MSERKISVSLEGRMDGLSRTLQQAQAETERHTREIRSSFDRVDQGIMSVGKSLGYLATGTILTVGLYQVKEAAKQAESAAMGLAVTARYTGTGIEAANLAAKSLASDGLMTISETSKGLQNLLSRGFGLDEAVKLMNGFKDSAAYGRQASLNFGEAVVTATEGLKNENSILVDNAGVTKNVSVMWKEYAAAHGLTVEQLTQAQKRHAELNGILKETEGQLGNAARMAEGFAGEEAKSAQKATELKETLGFAVQPALKAVLGIMTPVVGGLRDMVYWVETLGARAGGVYDKLKIRLGETFSMPKAGEATGFRERNARIAARMAEVDKNVDATIADIVSRSLGATAPDIGADTGKRRSDVVTPPRPSKKGGGRIVDGTGLSNRELDILRKEELAAAVKEFDQYSAQQDALVQPDQVNPYGKMTADQQFAFDQRAMISYWEARNDTLNRGAAEVANRLGAEGDPLAQLELQLDQEQQYYIDHWAMMADSEAQYQERVTEIDAIFSEKRKGLLRQEEAAKLNSTMQYTAATANLFGSLYEISGKKLKAFFYIQQAANAASAIMSGHKAGAAAFEPPPIGLGPLAGGPLAALMIAGGYASAAAIMTQTLTGPTGGGGASTASSGAGTPTNPVVAQPQYGSNAGSSLSVTVLVEGNVYQEDRWIEERLAPAIKDFAVNRNVDFGLMTKNP